MRAAITAVLPEPAPAITWTGPSGAVIAASCSGVGSWPRSAARTPGLPAAVRVALTVHLRRRRRAGPRVARRWVHAPAPGRPGPPGRPSGGRWGRGRPGGGRGPGTPRPAATWG